ncbi:oligomycin resistance ATP-dependent permease Yor1p [Monosporozyma servazzii]
MSITNTNTNTNSEQNSNYNAHREASITKTTSTSGDNTSTTPSSTPSSSSSASSNETKILPSGEYILDTNKPKTFLNSYDLEKVTDSEVYPQKRFFSFLHTKKIKEVPQRDEERTIYPMLHANPLSYIYFWWVTSVIRTGYKRTIQPNDLFIMDEKLSIERLYADFQKNMDWYTEKAKKKYLESHPNATENELISNVKLPKYTLPKILLFTFKKQFFLACLFALLANCASGFNPMVTKRLIEFVERKAIFHDTKINAGIGYAIGACVIMLINGIFFNHFFHMSQMCGSEVKAVLTKAALAKMLRASNYTKHKYPNGKVTSFVTTDASRIEFAISFQPFLVGFPAVLAICIVLLIVNVGAIALAGLGVFFMGCVLTLGIFKIILTIRTQANKFTDSRVSIMREILNNMKMVKYYAWEDAYEDNVVDIRTNEVRRVRKMQYIRNFIIALGMSIPNIASLVTFLAMYKVNNGARNPANLFSSLSTFQVLSIQMFFFPIAVGTGVDMVVGLGRIQDLLQSPDEEPIDVTPDADLDPSIALKIENGGFEWEDFEALDNAEEEKIKQEGKGKSDDPTSTFTELKMTKRDDAFDDSEKPFSHFKDLNFEIKKGELIIVTGPIGCGKSSLLNAMAGFMKMTDGKMQVNGDLLLCGYPWILNATVRDNIIFGSPYHKEKYEEVLRVCSLGDDLKILPAGDRTEIGERGITLSGGQKARINLARAVYKNKDIFLFDDVLSAVDARVGKHIMDECLLGLLGSKTRILATHQLSLIEKADRVIVLSSGGDFDIGTYDKLSQSNTTLVNLLKFTHQTNSKVEGDVSEETLEGDYEFIKEEEEAKTLEVLEKQMTIKSIHDGHLITKEERAVNSIKLKVYSEYIKAGVGKWGPLVLPLYALFIAGTTFCNLFSSVWLSYWTENKWPDKSTSFYMGMYSFFVFGAYTFMNLQFTLLCTMGINASKTLNLAAVRRVLHTPMAFLDTTPLGRILNRFTKDTDSLDNELTESIRMMMAQVGNVIGVIVMCIVYLPWFAIAVPFLVIIFALIADHYQSSGREIKRLEAVQRSFVYNNFNEVLTGMDTIKAYGSADRFLVKTDFLINKMNEAGYLSIAVQRWVALLLDSVAVAFALIITLLCVTRTFSISAASVGVLLTYVLQLPGILNTILRSLTQTENDMNSAERMVTYATELPLEEAYKKPECSPPESWPEKGEIVFKDVDFAYRPGLPVVLKNMNVTIKSGEKIGICGRTGAGKSTIMSALYRLNELSGGEIYIDGVDVSKLGLFDLRRKLTIIPQDPVLFRGTVRKNLDPFNNCSEELLWDALERSGAIDIKELEDVKKEKPEANNSHANMHKFHLDQSVEEEGSNYSLGERQVLALTRALVRQSKILILDEATSSVDYETDGKIQSRIVEEFGDCTILCIAHRLKTILGYDRILVLEKGIVTEFDTPWKLFSDEESIFRNMCSRAGISEADFVKKE